LCECAGGKPGRVMKVKVGKFAPTTGQTGGLLPTVRVRAQWLGPERW
jgi:hypothetical protein